MKKRLLKCFVAVSLIVATLLPCGVWASASAEAAGTVADFGLADPERNTTVFGSAFLELLLGASVGEAEAAYINQNGQYQFIYSDAIPASSITAKLTAEGVRITVSDWTYTAQNGATVCWEPVRVTVNAVTKDVDGAGTYLFEGDWTETERFDISAEYATEFLIGATLYNSLANYAYLEAEKKDGELLVYDVQKAKYDADLAAYNDYQQKLKDYDLALAYYRLYLKDLEEYRQKQTNYENYLVRLEQYEAAKEAYDAYELALEAYKTDKAAYDAYCRALDNYQTQLGYYNNYLSHVASRVQRLSTMEGIYTRNSLGQSLYATVLGDTVDTVVKNKDEIVTYTKTPAEAVDLAGACTENLRRMLKEYKELGTDREKYLYYEGHYDALCRNFKDLYEALRSFYDNTIVCTILNSAGKLERYRQFLAQLYVITTALDDSYQRDENWKLQVDKDTYVSVGDLLEEVHVLRDTGTTNPKNYAGWPAEVAEPVKPQEVARPTKPDEVASPGRKPTEVIQPTAPDVVEEPTAPTDVQSPGSAPSPVKMTAAQKAIVEALREGEISRRDEVTEDVAIRKTATVSKVIRDLEKHHVRFMNGNTVVFECDIADGGMLVLPTEIPEKDSTAEFHYFFACWKDKDGQEAVAAPVDSDLDFYASFTSQRRSYEITWDVDGVTHTERVEYGTVPGFEGETDKPRDERNIYTFAGWEPAPARVMGDAVYTAKYDKTARLYDVTWKMNGATVVEQYPYAASPVYKGIVELPSDDTYTYTFEGWSPSLSAVTGNVTYEAVYSKKSLALDSMEEPLSVRIENASYVVQTDGRIVDVTALYEQALQKEYGITVEFASCTLKISALNVSRLSHLGMTKIAARVDHNRIELLICDANGNVIEGGEPVDLEYENPDTTGAKIFGLVNGREEPIYMENGMAVLSIASGQSIAIIKKYTVSVTHSEEGSMTVSTELAEAGTVILLRQDFIRSGYVVKEIKVTAKDGTPVAVDMASMTFQMPVGGATVDVVYERQTFKVTFVSEGKVISETLYYLGDEVVLPADPVKDPQGKYTYTFAGWTPEITLVEGDAEYTAIFTEHKLADESEMSEHNFKSREYEWLILFGVVVVVMAGACVLILHRKKSKRKYNG